MKHHEKYAEAVARAQDAFRQRNELFAAENQTLHSETPWRDRLIQWQLAEGLDIAAAAVTLGVSYQTYAHMRTGRKEIPRSIQIVIELLTDLPRDVAEMYICRQSNGRRKAAANEQDISARGPGTSH